MSLRTVRHRRRFRQAGLCLLVVLVPGPEATGQPGVAVNSLSAVRTAASPGGGLELGMPRQGSYALGIAHDIKGRWSESYRAYAQAHAEFRAELARRPAWAHLVGGWVAKAKFQMLQSSRLLSLRHAMKGRTSSVDRLYDQGNVLQNKWLAIRAFAGRSVPKHSEAALKAYRRALDLSPGHRAARIGLATLLHEMGRGGAARAEYRKLVRPVPSYLDLERARYHAAAGDRLAALRLLHRVIASRDNRDQIYASNDFDGLRPLRAFRRLLGR